MSKGAHKSGSKKTRGHGNPLPMLKQRISMPLAMKERLKNAEPVVKGTVKK